jgi:hypothetical protein
MPFQDCELMGIRDKPPHLQNSPPRCHDTALSRAYQIIYLRHFIRFFLSDCALLVHEVTTKVY